MKEELEKLEEWWKEHCEGYFVPIKQARKTKIVMQGEIKEAIVVDMSEIRVKTEMELANMGLSLFRPPRSPNIGYIYEE